MNLREMILEVRSAIDDQSARMWTDTEITRWLNQAVRIMCSTALPLQAVYSTTTTASIQEYVLPEDVVRVYSVGFYNGIVYWLRPADFAQAQPGTLITGIPSSFYLKNRTTQLAPQTSTGITPAAQDANNPTAPRIILGLLPVPSSASTLLVYYFSRHTLLNVDTQEPQIPEEFHDGICAYAIGKAKEKDLAYEEGQLFLQRFRDHTEALKNSTFLDGQDLAFPHVTNPGEADYTSLDMDARFILPS
jgi:hypothetical protein